MPTAAGGLSFGPFHLLASERLLTREGAAVELGSRALDILIVLISTANEPVSKKELISRVWPDVVVEEGSLRFHMAGLRKALGDGKDGARYIATLLGRGYCFVAPISRPSSAGDDAPIIAANFQHANIPSTLSRSYCGVQPLQLNAGVGCGELPVRFGVVLVAAVLPGGDFSD